MKKRILFDRSAFHGTQFDLLLNSPLLELSKQRRISIYHSPILIEETTQMYLKQKNRGELRRQLPFIFEICQERWLNERTQIWIKELVEDAGERGSIFLPDGKRRQIEGNLSRMVFQDDVDAAMFEEAIRGVDDNRAKAAKIKESAVRMREEISRQLKEHRLSRKNIKQTAGEYVNAVLDDTGVEIIKKHLPVSNTLEISEKWKCKKERYPYFTHFARGLLYSGYYAMAYPNEAIDDNALTDISLLCYAHGMDLMVSNEEGFMKKAFDFMFAGK